MSHDTYDKDSRLKIPFEDLEHVSYKKTASNKIAKRVSNDADNPLYVQSVADAPTGDDVYEFDSEAAVPEDSPTLLVRYEVPVGKVFYLDGITAGGENYAKFTVTINGQVNKVGRIDWGTGFNIFFKYNSYKITAGDAVEVIVENCSDGSADFEGTIEGRTENV